MKKLFLLFLFIFAFAVPVNAFNPLMVCTGAVASGCTSVTVDLWQTFEFDTLNADNLAANDNNADTVWSVVDTGSKLTTSASGETTLAICPNGTADTGTRGLAYDTDGSVNAYVQAVTDSAHANVSVGFFWKSPSPGNWDDGQTIFNESDCSGWTIVWSAGGSVPRLGMATSAGSTGVINIEDATVYWITSKFVDGGTSSIAVYASDQTTQIGATQTKSSFAGEDPQTFQFMASVTWGADNIGDTYIDDILIDYADATFPLGTK